MIQGLLVLNYSPDSYTFERWHGTLLYWAILAFAALANIYGSRLLPMIENMTLALHVILFFVILIVMAVVSPMKNTAKFVFTDFENQSGWSSDGVAWCIGLLSSCYVLIGYDGATHLSEEMQNPAVGVPYAMVGSVVINAVMGFAFLLTILFCMGDITTALGTSTGFPIIQIFYGITGNLHAASAMTCAIIVMAILATIPLMSSAARMTWAFARDGGEHCVV
jgi:amino acid transporter